MSKYYETLEDLPLFNWSKYLQTKDNNWLIVGYDGKQEFEVSEYLVTLESLLQDEYFELINNDNNVDLLQKRAKQNYLVLKYETILMLIENIRKGFNPEQQEIRATFISLLAKLGFKVPLINDYEGDLEEMLNIENKLAGIVTQIQILQDDLDVDLKTDNTSLNKQLILVSLGLELGYALNAKNITVAEWIEYCKLLEEKNEKIQRSRNKQ